MGHTHRFSASAGQLLDRADVQAHASRPRHDGTLQDLLDATVAAMVQPRRLPASAAVKTTASVIRGTSWGQYRTGKARLASLAASYLGRLAPPSSWQLTDIITSDERRCLLWQSPDGIDVIDVLSRGADNAQLDRALTGDNARIGAVRFMHLDENRYPTVRTGCDDEILMPGSVWDLTGTWS